MVQTLRKLYGALKIVVKKKGLANMADLRKQFTVEEQNIVEINAKEIYDQFQEILEVLER